MTWFPLSANETRPPVVTIGLTPPPSPYGVALPELTRFQIWSRSAKINDCCCDTPGGVALLYVTKMPPRIGPEGRITVRLNGYGFSPGRWYMTRGALSASFGASRYRLTRV